MVVKFRTRSQPFLKRLKLFLRCNMKHRLRVMLILLVVIASIACIHTYCADSPFEGLSSDDRQARAEAVEEEATGMRGLDNKLYDSIVYSGSDVDDAQGLVRVQINPDSCSIGTYELDMVGGYSSGLIHDVGASVASIAVSIAAIMWCISLGTAIINNSVYKEIVFKKTLIAIITVICIMKSITFVSGICDAGCYLVDEMAGNYATDTDINVPFLDNSRGMQYENCELRYDGSYADVNLDENNSYPDVSDLAYYYYKYDTYGDQFEAMADDYNSKLTFIGRLPVRINNWIKQIPPSIAATLNFYAINPVLVFVLIIIPWLIHGACRLLLFIITFARGIEIVVISLFAPLPFALISGGRLGEGAGARYLKNIAALALQGAVMLGVVIICSATIQDVSSGINFMSVSPGHEAQYLLENYGELWKIIAVQVAEVMLLFKANGIAQKVLGLA